MFYVIMNICIVISFQVKTMMILSFFFKFRGTIFEQIETSALDFFAIVLKGEEVITDFILKSFFFLN